MIRFHIHKNKTIRARQQETKLKPSREAATNILIDIEERFGIQITDKDYLIRLYTTMIEQEFK